MAEYRRGQGPNALPQGGASAANAATPPPAELENMDIPVQFAPGEADPIPDGPEGDEVLDTLLAAPFEGFRPGATPRERPGRVPKYVVRNLPLLMAAAKDPEAPPTIRALYRATIRHLEQEMRQGG